MRIGIDLGGAKIEALALNGEWGHNPLPNWAPNNGLLLDCYCGKKSVSKLICPDRVCVNNTDI